VLNDSNSSFALPLGFACGLTDPNTQFIRFGVRDYDPEVGRWTAREPLLFADGLDAYAYCRNDPANFLDINGLERRHHSEAWSELAAQAYAEDLKSTSRLRSAYQYFTNPPGELTDIEKVADRYDVKRLKGTHFFDWRGMKCIEADSFGNMYAGYALTEAYGAPCAWLMCAFAEYQWAPKRLSPDPEDRDASFRDNAIGVKESAKNTPYLKDSWEVESRHWF